MYYYVLKQKKEKRNKERERKEIIIKNQLSINGSEIDFASVSLKTRDQGTPRHPDKVPFSWAFCQASTSSGHSSSLNLNKCC